jgi:hypothetical protein
LRGGVSLVEQDTNEYVSWPIQISLFLKKKIRIFSADATIFSN